MSVMCDVCSMPVNFSDGYALTTKQVTTEPKYWEFMLDRHSFDDQLLVMYVQQQAMQRTGWLVCETCSNLFSFNRQDAKKYAERQMDPPGSGPADVQYVAAAAAKAWKNKHGAFPTWTR